MKFYSTYRFSLLVLIIVLAACQAPEAVPVETSPAVIANAQDTDAPAADSEESLPADIASAPDTEAPAADNEEAAPAEIASAPDTEAPAADSEEAAHEPWQIVQELAIEHQPPYTAFMNEQTGATICGWDDHAPSFTADGGQSWTQPDSKDACPNIVDIVNAQSIWECTPGSLFASKDGGQSLENLTFPPGDECQLLHFLDDETGWSASTANLAVTKDGANSWEAIPLPEEVSNIVAISLRSAEAGYLLDLDGTLYSTTDGGQNWAAQTLDFEDDDLALMRVGQTSAAIRFLDKEKGVVIMNLGGNFKSAVVAMHTTDGGQSWEHHLLPVDLGGLFLSHDGQYLTVSDWMEMGKVTLLQR